MLSLPLPIRPPLFDSDRPLLPAVCPLLLLFRPVLNVFVYFIIAGPHAFWFSGFPRSFSFLFFFLRSEAERFSFFFFSSFSSLFPFTSYHDHDAVACVLTDFLSFFLHSLLDSLFNQAAGLFYFPFLSSSNWFGCLPLFFLLFFYLQTYYVCTLVSAVSARS